MLHLKSKRIRSAVCLFVISVLLTPALTHANTTLLLAEATETGSTASRQAAEQRAALAKKAAEREAAKKAAETEASSKAAVPTGEQKGK